MSLPNPKVCVIGAGPSGLVATKVLSQQGLDVCGFEKGSDVGGLWRFQNDSKLSAAYESLHINSSRHAMAYSDFPMKAELPDFPHHSHILSYLEDYTAAFGLRERYRFQSTVQNVQPLEQGGFEVTTESGNVVSRDRFHAVVVANGHHWSPKTPEMKGDFNGVQLHSHDFKNAKPFSGQRVLVVGIGNSGVDMACELSRVCERVVLSTRRGAHVIPKYLLGKPLDRLASRFFWTWCPLWLRQRLFALVLKMTRGRQSRYGLPEPPYRVLQEHPTVSSELLNLLGHGKIHIRPDIDRLAGDDVAFVDGRREQFDSIIYATGYNIRFPFLDSDLIDTTDNRIGLYKKVVHPDHPGLFFTGLVQPWGPLMPLAEAQAEWICSLLQSQSTLPSKASMLKEIESSSQKMARRYTESSRHTIQVDFYPYLDEMKKAMAYRRGQLLYDKLPELNGGIGEDRVSSQAA